MAGYLLPGIDDRLEETMTMIFGEAPAMAAADADAIAPSHAGVYVDAEGEYVAVCFCDMGAATALACGLSLIPNGLAEEMLQAGSLSDVASENLHEVMNMFRACS